MYVLPVAITFVSVATLAVAARLFTRIHLACAPGWDDWTLLLSLLTDWAFFAFLIIEAHYGLGEPQSSLEPHEIRAQLKALWISIPLYNLTLNLTKISMVFLYIRLFPTAAYRIVLIIVLVFVVTSGLWMVLSTLLFCIPVRAFWDPHIPHSCLSEAVVWSLNAALQITSDLIIVLLPMPVLAKLRIPLRQKLALMVLFALGLFVCVTSVVRLHAVVGLLDSKDISLENGPAATWSFIESNVAILCASLPPLRPLLIHICPRLLPSRIRSSYFQREKRSQDQTKPSNPFPLHSTSYSASVTGNCSTSIDGHDSGSHRQPGAEGIQVVSELRWDSDIAHSKDEDNPLGDPPGPENSSQINPGFNVRFASAW